MRSPIRFADVVFRADSEEKARAVMEGDPGVRGGIFRARLFPYQVILEKEDLRQKNTFYRDISV
jgi:hypothetical protein